MNAAALKRFKGMAVATMTALWPGTITVAGRRYSAAVKLQPVLLSIPGGGTLEHRGLNALILKSALPSEPKINSTVIHEGLEYIVNSFTGREDFEIHWRLICIEKERQP